MRGRKIIRVRLYDSVLKKVWAHTKNAQTNGGSNVHGDHAERVKQSGPNQAAGLLGQCAYLYWKNGSAAEFLRMRFHQDLNPDVGDGGYDFTACRVDVKCSQMTSKRKTSIWGYNFIIPKVERKSEWVYAQAFVEKLDSEQVQADGFVDVYLVGWLTDEMIKGDPNGVGDFKDKYVIPVKTLHPIMPMMHENMLGADMSLVDDVTPKIYSMAA